MYNETMSSLKEQIIEKLVADGYDIDADNDEIAKLFEGRGHCIGPRRFYLIMILLIGLCLLKKYYC